MSDYELVRTNIYFEKDVLEVVDEFAKLMGRSRSHCLRSLLRPSIPALQALLDAAHEAKTDEKAVMERLDNIERALTNTMYKLPDAISGNKGATNEK